MQRRKMVSTFDMDEFLANRIDKNWQRYTDELNGDLDKDAAREFTQQTVAEMNDDQAFHEEVFEECWQQLNRRKLKKSKAVKFIKKMVGKSDNG